MSNIGAWSSFKRTWRHQAVMQSATLTVLIGSFVVLAMALLAHQNFHSQLAQWGNAVKVSVYLNEEAGQADSSRVSRFLEETGAFKEVRYVSKDEALVQFRARMAQHLPGLLTDLEIDNPLPASIEATVRDGLGGGYKFEQLLQIVNDVKTQPEVDEVSYGQGWIENYASVLKVFSTTTAIFLITLLVGSLFVVGNSIRSSILQRREEIEILELCGATRRMILWPFVFEGFLTGFLAAFIAIGLCYFLYVWQIDLLSGRFTFWDFKVKFEFLSFGRFALILFTGAVVGAGGSYLWARRLATGWSAAEASSR